MEDGISKGFVRSSDQVARNLTMLSQMTGNSPLWQGEQGARRLMDMNSGLEAATGLQSASDIIAFRAARNLAGDGASYVDAQKILEQGLTPALFKEYMNLSSKAEGRDNREGMVERMRQTFNLNYNTADQLYKAWKDNKALSDEQLQAILNRQGGVPEASNTELHAAIMTQSTVYWWTQQGRIWFDTKLNDLRDEMTKAREAFQRLAGINTAPTPYRSPVTNINSLHTPLDPSRTQHINDAIAYSRRFPVVEDIFQPGPNRALATLFEFRDSTYRPHAGIFADFDATIRAMTPEQRTILRESGIVEQVMPTTANENGLEKIFGLMIMVTKLLEQACFKQALELTIENWSP
jgi:hypothetical protein